MTITGDDISQIATRAAGYLSDLAIITPVPLSTEFAAASATATALAANQAECDAIATTITTTVDAVNAVWDYIKSKGHLSAASALRAV